MTRFGGNEFTAFSVPLIFEGRYFIFEPGDPPLITVIVEQDGLPVFEVLKNRPRENNVTAVSINPTGVITVSDSTSGRFLYKIRPGSETSVVFGKLGGGELHARITDRLIEAGGITLANCVFNGAMTGIVIRADGSWSVGGVIPTVVRRWLSTQ